MQGVGPSLVKVLRIFRVVRALKLVKTMESLQKLVNMIIVSFPALMNMTSLLLLDYFFFSILSASIFEGIVFKENGWKDPLTLQQAIGVIYGPGFQNFLQAFLTLFRVSTGEVWYRIMFDTTRDRAYGCLEGDSCGACTFLIQTATCSSSWPSSWSPSTSCSTSSSSSSSRTSSSTSSTRKTP